MPLTNKLKADYVELINKQLDHIPMESVEEIDLIKEALSNINNPTAGYSVPETLRERIFDVSDILNSPEDYVESEQNYAEYQQIIRDRINAKVVELQSLSEGQKLADIQAHHERGTAAAQYQQQIAERQAPKPGSDAHTITEEEFLRQRELEFSRQPAPLVSEARIQEAVNLSDGLFTAADLAGMDRSAISAIIEPACLQALRDELFTVANLAGMDGADIRAIIEPACLQALRDELFTAADLAGMDGPAIRAIIEPACLQALHDGRTTIDLLAQMDSSDLYRANATGEYPAPAQPNL